MKRVLVAVAMLWATPAFAQQSKADQLFEQGQAHYQAGEFQAAIEAFKQAYELVHDPVYLFNLGQSYRKVADCVAAAENYDRYLAEDPNAQNREKVEQWLRELQPCVAQRKAEREAAKRAEELERKQREQAAQQQQREREIDRGRGMRVSGIALGVVGLVGIGAGAAFSVRGKRLRDDLAVACGMMCNWDDPGIQQKDRDGQRANTFAIVGYVGGGVALATGIALYVVGRSRVEHVAVTPTEGGATVSAQLRF